MYVPRLLEDHAHAMFQAYPIVTLTGPRQSGKTTLARHCFAHLPYANLEEPQTRAMASADPAGFLDQYPNGLLLDEIQRLPELLSWLQVRVDGNPRPGQYVLTGSEQFGLKRAVGQSLAGRTAVLHLLPLSMAELASQGPLPDLPEMLFKGFYPRIHATGLPAYQAHSDYIQTYLERDLRQQGEIRMLSTFQRFLGLCAGRVGQLLNLNSLANDLGVATSTLRDWLAILEAGYVVFLLQPWHGNIRKRLVKTPKLYFHDVGLATFLLGIEHADQLNNHPLVGNLFENLCVTEVLKHRFNRGLRNTLCFYRDSVGNEVDLLLERPGQPLLLEIKASRTLHADFTRGFDAFTRATGHTGTRVIAYRGEPQPAAFGAQAWNFTGLDSGLANLQTEETSAEQP